MASPGSKGIWASRETRVITELLVLMERMDQRGQRAKQDPWETQEFLG